MTSGVGSVRSEHSFVDGWNGSTSWAVGRFGAALVVLLVAVALVLGGWTLALSRAYAAPSGAIESASGATPTRQPVVDTAPVDIGTPARQHEVGREHRLLTADGEPGQQPRCSGNRSGSTGEEASRPNGPGCW